MKPIIVCTDCGRERQHCARGLCTGCYERHRRELRYEIRGYRPRNWTSGATLVEDYEEVRDWGTRDLVNAAARLGVKRDTLYMALYRRGYKPDGRGGYVK